MHDVVGSQNSIPPSHGFVVIAKIFQDVDFGNQQLRQYDELDTVKSYNFEVGGHLCNAQN